MRGKGRGELLILLTTILLIGVGACEGGQIVVFSSAQPGAAGDAAGAGSSGGTAAGAPGNEGISGASASSGLGGFSGNPQDQSCQSTDDCDPSWYCQKEACADVAGVCLPRPSLDDPRLLPVCGCDGITYWNDTLRQALGISWSSGGWCRSGTRRCYSGSECGPNGRCSRQLPGFTSSSGSDMPACDAPGAGQCWAIPNDCTSANDGPVGLPCPPPGPPTGPPPDCLTLCQALQADKPYVRLPMGVHCP